MPCTIVADAYTIVCGISARLDRALSYVSTPLTPYLKVDAKLRGSGLQKQVITSRPSCTQPTRFDLDNMHEQIIHMCLYIYIYIYIY